MSAASRRHAFSLIELAVVLVVIGMLVGVIAGGQNLMRQSEMQQLITQAAQMKGAMTAFFDQYARIPGDMQDATELWGFDPDGCPTHTVRTPRTGTCDGDGNGRITGAEAFRAIQQLANAGMVQGAYTGVAGPDGAEHSVPGENILAGLDNSGIGIWTDGPYHNDSHWFDMPAATLLQFGISAGGRPDQPFLTPRDANQLDSKIDDGMPATGLMLAYKSPRNPDCTTDDSPTARYNLVSPEMACSLAYQLTGLIGLSY